MTWYGQRFFKHSTTLRPENVDGLEITASPATGVELVQCAPAMQWQGTSIPRFADHIKPLLDVPEVVYNKAGARTKCTLYKILQADVSWFLRAHHASEL